VELEGIVPQALVPEFVIAEILRPSSIFVFTLLEIRSSIPFRSGSGTAASPQ
jgi:hypothetical protein